MGRSRLFGRLPSICSLAPVGSEFMVRNLRITGPEAPQLLVLAASPFLLDPTSPIPSPKAKPRPISGSLLGTTLVFCYYKTLVRIKIKNPKVGLKMLVFNMAPTGNQKSDDFFAEAHQANCLWSLCLDAVSFSFTPQP